MGVMNGGKKPLPKPIPERIREARESRGLTPDEFAEALDVSRQAVAQYETGQASPSGEVLSKIIAITAQPPLFFTTPRERARQGTPFWRSLKRMEQHHRRRITRRLEWVRDITAYVGEFIDLPPVNLPKIDFDPENAIDDDIEKAAETLRDHWNLGRRAILNLASVLEANGIVIVREVVDCPDMDAVSCWQGGRPYLLSSGEVISGPRSKYNLAHELGHILLHASVELSIDNLSRIERQANRFAGAFLLPRETFSNEVLGTSVSYFKSLKARWGVAIAAMAYRCKDLKIFNENQHSYLMRQMNALRIRNPEPLDEMFPVEKPSMLAQSLKMLIEEGVQNREQVETALTLNLGDIESLCGVPKGFLDARVVQFQPRPRDIPV
ncbi:MAG: XRE family transcriptional regulator [Pseudolabrys sp.]|nr:XRE family transcriptional regulator [Pseudolabrys sp.]MDP2295949.1 XRE family transcriptional regulator [Pseudolabrys sp.]